MSTDSELLVVLRQEELITWMRLGFSKVPAERIFIVDPAEVNLPNGFVADVGGVLPTYEEEYEVVLVRCSAEALHESLGRLDCARRFELDSRHVRSLVPVSNRAASVLRGQIGDLLPVEEPRWEKEFLDLDRSEQRTKKRTAISALREMFGLPFKDAANPVSQPMGPLDWARQCDLETDLVERMQNYRRPIATKEFPSGDLGYFFDLGRILKTRVGRTESIDVPDAPERLRAYGSAVQELPPQLQSSDVLSIFRLLRGSVNQLTPICGFLSPLSIILFLRMRDQWQVTESVRDIVVDHLVEEGQHDSDVYAGLISATSLLASVLGFNQFYEEFAAFRQEVSKAQTSIDSVLAPVFPAVAEPEATPYEVLLATHGDKDATEPDSRPLAGPDSGRSTTSGQSELPLGFLDDSPQPGHLENGEENQEPQVDAPTERSSLRTSTNAPPAVINPDPDKRLNHPCEKPKHNPDESRAEPSEAGLTNDD